MNTASLVPLLPAAKHGPSRWSFWLKRQARRQGVDLAAAVVGAGLPWPIIKNEAGRMRIGRAFLASGVRLWAHKGGELTIGDNTVLDENVEIVAWSSVRIGSGCRLGWDVLVMDTDLHGVAGQPVDNRPVVIEDGVSIGCRAMILKGVTIGQGAHIHAGAVVTRDVPAGAEVRAVPATVIKTLSENEQVGTRL
jgi:acetyltransferase-like isoleucine patch superfamily enzyme